MFLRTERTNDHTLCYMLLKMRVSLRKASDRLFFFSDKHLNVNVESSIKQQRI